MEFSVENRAALKAKEQRTLKSKEKGSAVEVGVTDKSVKATVVEIENGRPAPEFSGTKADRKITGLPSHSGPKIRHVKREKQQGEGTVAVRKPKITRKMFKNPEKRKLSTQKKSTQVNFKVHLVLSRAHIGQFIPRKKMFRSRRGKWRRRREKMDRRGSTPWSRNTRKVSRPNLLVRRKKSGSTRNIKLTF